MLIMIINADHDHDYDDDLREGQERFPLDMTWYSLPGKQRIKQVHLCLGKNRDDRTGKPGILIRPRIW